jgi:cytochrome b6-f complex iron-sulfur subunit
MADKSKMTVAEILAAARKADKNQGTAPAAEPAASPAEAAAPSAAEAAEEAIKPSPPAAPVKKPGGGRPSVAEMLAMARGETKAPAAEEKPAAKPSSKPTAKPAAAAAKKEPAAAPAGPVDTQSILAAARSVAKPGPMTKAEAAARTASRPAADAQKAKAKEAIVVPPMPARPEYATPAVAKSKDAERLERRLFILGISALGLGFAALTATMAIWSLLGARFMFPNIVRLPPTRFRVGGPDKFAPGQVEEKFKAQFGVWVVNTEYNGQQQIFALKSVCTHLGCTPNWLEAEQKFKCPCHGSGFYKDGINFEGPAPRPLERYAISIASDGQLEVDKSRIFQQEIGQWSDPASFVPV